MRRLAAITVAAQPVIAVAILIGICMAMRPRSTTDAAVSEVAEALAAAAAHVGVALEEIVRRAAAW